MISRSIKPSLRFMAASSCSASPKSETLYKSMYKAFSEHEQKREFVMPKGGLLSHGCGEDAFLTRSNSICVADGVGGWSSFSNGNAALYSRLLVHFIGEEIEAMDDVNNLDTRIMNLKAWEIVENAYNRLKEYNTVIGSCTVTVALLREQTLSFAHLGDCGFMLFRPFQGMILRSEDQQYSFNYPYQIGTQCKATPQKDCIRVTAVVHPGDVLLLASDGLFDNVADSTIANQINRFIKEHSKVATQDALDDLVHELNAIALEASLDTNHSSPFSQRAMEEGLYCQGGKIDDITIVAGLIQELEDSPDRR